MIIALALSLLILFVLLLVLWWPLFRASQDVSKASFSLNHAIATSELKQGAMLSSEEQTAFQQECALLALTGQCKQNDGFTPATSRDYRKISAGLTVVVIALSAAMYTVIGQPQRWSVELTSQNTLESLTDNDPTDAQLQALKQAIKANPNDREAWFVLVEYYLYSNQFESALIALKQVERLNGTNAESDFGVETREVKTAEAMIRYYQQGQKIDAQVQAILDEVLATEPMNVAALMLIASDNYYQGKYGEALAIWQALLDSENPNIDRIMLIERINITKMMLSRQ